jgi:hypothetical protein
MLKASPSERINVDEALNHPFITGQITSGLSIKNNKFM